MKNDFDFDDDEDLSHIQPRDCAACGKPIPLLRLSILPKTHHCVACTDKYGPKVFHDPEILCAKASPSGQNGFAPKS